MTSCGLSGIHPVTLRISVTHTCQMRCLYCTPEKHQHRMNKLDQIEYGEIMRFVNFLQHAYGLSKVRITGGEPLLRNGLDSLIRMLSTSGVGEITLTTNAQLLSAHARALRDAGLSRLNISLDSVNPETFRAMTRGGDLQLTLDGIAEARKCGLAPIKLNMVVMRGVNDREVIDMARFGIENECQIRYLELMPIGISPEQFQQWFVSSADIEQKLAERFSLTLIPGELSSSSRNFRIADETRRAGIVGFISPKTVPFCAGCRRLRLKSDGHLVGCLARKTEWDIRPFLADDQTIESPRLKEMIESALNNKQAFGKFQNNDTMAEIGG